MGDAVLQRRHLVPKVALLSLMRLHPRYEAMTVIDPRSGSRLMLHPETEHTLSSHEDFVGAIVWVEERLAPLYRIRAQLREEMAARFPPPELPRAPHRTEKQERVARCPRCGGRDVVDQAPE